VSDFEELVAPSEVEYIDRNATNYFMY